MGKHGKEPVESIEPSVNGLEELSISFLESAKHGENEESQDLLPVIAEEEDMPVALIFGSGEFAEALGELAEKCGFETRAVRESSNLQAPLWAQEIYEIENFNNIVEDCGIERNFYICIMEESLEACELILSQTLASDASYIGLAGDTEKIGVVFDELRKDGVPDTELAAIAAPMGLNIGATTPQEQAVAVVAEMLAAKAGKLKRLRQSHK